MKLERTRSAIPATASGPFPLARRAMAPAPVASASGDPERERSLQQELDTVETLATGDFQGAEMVLAQAHELMAQLISDGASGLLRAMPGAAQPHIDDEA